MRFIKTSDLNCEIEMDLGGDDEIALDLNEIDPAFAARQAARECGELALGDDDDGIDLD